jgi:dipeptidyl aminopeptidase/acylaminoacyl peptidase
MVTFGNAEGFNSVLLVNFDKQLEKKVVVEERLYEFLKPVWSSSNKSFAFLKRQIETSDSSICFYNIETQKLEYFSKITQGFPDGYLLNSEYVNITISPDDKRVIFDLRKNLANEPTPEIVKVWKGSDALVYPKRIKLSELEHKIRYGVWHPEKNQFRFVTSDQRPIHLLNPTMDIALTYSISDKEPQHNMYLTVDYYISNLETGEEQLMIANQTSADRFSGFSPNGDFFAYYKDNKWFIYDLKKQTQLSSFQTNITNWEFIQNGDKSIYGIAGWGLENNYIYLHDQYDVWKVPFDGSNPTRLTQGREQKIRYRLLHFSENVQSNFSGSVLVDLTKDLILAATGENATGYFIRKPNGTIKKMVYNNCLNSNLVKSANVSLYVYQSQNYNKPQSLNSYHSKTQVMNNIFQSNPLHFRFLWGNQEEIYFLNAKNKRLKGVLFYPVEYDANKKYPMVVSIYQELNYLKHYYFNPSFYNSAGFNVANLTAQGYFVLLPDIEYEMGNPGYSATDCVVAATNQVISMGIIASDKIALMGHSFGGYETNFIITQSSLFKTAISGASVFDLPSWYLSISKNTGDPEIWRFEYQQWRMQKSLYENRECYERNSPSKWVENVTTPLLIWTGEYDTQINPDQSIAFHLALRRLNKQNVLLIYNNESHALIQKESQIDFYHKINDWLSHYLKSEPPKPWMIKGS